jgi:hypothetical protein
MKNEKYYIIIVPSSVGVRSSFWAHDRFDPGEAAGTKGLH